MCQFCEQYGDGGKWYLNPKNYARRLYKVRKPETEAKGKEADPQAAGMGGGVINAIIAARVRGDAAAEAKLKEDAVKFAYAMHFGQVVTLEETLQILDLAYPIAKMTCACRRVQWGLADARNFTCMGIGPGMYKWERWPETYRGGVEFLSAAEAKEWVMLCDQMGLVHTLDAFGTPYIGGLCQCDYPGCVAIRNRLDYEFKFLVKGEWFAKVNWERCTGCEKCIARCHFRAMGMNVNTRKALVDPLACFGCGLCRSVCAADAITLSDRNLNPRLKDMW